MQVVLVGERWGPHENRWKHPLVWWSGRELARMISDSGLGPGLRTQYPTEPAMIDHWKWLATEHNIAVTNVFNEYPLNDNAELFLSTPNFAERDNIAICTDISPIKINNRLFYLRESHRHHIERMWSEIEQYKPNLVVALGNFACWALLGRAGITAIRGTPKLTIRHSIKCIPTYNPAALSNWKLRPTIVSDLCKAAREAEYPEIRRIQRYITCEDPRTKQNITLDEIASWLAQPADSYACDIETGYVLFTGPELKAMTVRMKRIISELISMVSLARSPYDSLVIPFMTRDDPELSYWKTAKEEAQAWNMLRGALKSDIPKTFQNGIFDISCFLRIGITVRNCKDDTMVLQHAESPEENKGLGEIASRQTNEISWKQMRSSGETLKREE